MDQDLLSISLINQARIMNELFDGKPLDSHRYKVFSQWDEDGIIQYIVRTLNPSPYFVEIGVGDYSECNTRLLNEKDGWTGIVIEQDIGCCNSIINRPDFWRRGITVINQSIHAENVNTIIENHCKQDIGLLSIDIDGNDFWVWRALEVVRPPIVIIEFNSVFGKDLSVTIPYIPGFSRTEHHYSNLYAGASLLAMIRLGGAKGYAFVGSNSGRNNAFFVRTDLLSERLPEISGSAVFHEPPFRESRSPDGRLTYLSTREGRQLIRTMLVVETIAGRTLTLAQAMHEAGISEEAESSDDDTGGAGEDVDTINGLSNAFELDVVPNQSATAADSISKTSD